MDEAKRRGRPPKNKPEVQEQQQPPVKPALYDAVTIYESNWGETKRPEPPTFAALVEYVHKINSWERRITCVIHPDASGVVESERFGNIRTEQGPAGYYVSITEKAQNENGDELPFVSHRTEKVAL